VAAATGVVLIEATHNVKPEKAAQVSPLPINRPAEFLSKLGLDLAGEPVSFQHTGQLVVEPLTAIGQEGCRKTPPNTCYEYGYGCRSHKVPIITDTGRDLQT
jgi:hypothetical protein